MQCNTIKYTYFLFCIHLIEIWTRLIYSITALYAVMFCRFYLCLVTISINELLALAESGYFDCIQSLDMKFIKEHLAEHVPQWYI